MGGHLGLRTKWANHYVGLRGRDGHKFITKRVANEAHQYLPLLNGEKINGVIKKKEKENRGGDTFTHTRMRKKTKVLGKGAVKAKSEIETRTSG